MSDLRKAAEMALKALNTLYLNDYSGYEICKQEAYLVDDAIQALIKALAQPEQEPLAWVQEDVCRKQFMSTGNQRRLWWECENGVGFPIYCAPPKRKWVGLTDDEIESFDGVEMKYIGTGEYVTEGEYEFARAIEAKLKEKNT